MVANAFAFHDSLRSIVGEFASQGSGPYGLRHNAVLEGSEKVEIVVRDRNQPTRVLRVRQTVHDPAGDHDWVVEAVVDLDATDEVGELVMPTTAFRRL